MKDAKFETLKNGLGNGLAVQDNTGKTLTLEGLIKKSKKLLLNNGNIQKWKSSIHCTPHLFLLEYLTKEITVEGYNGGEPFVPIEWIEENCSIGHYELINQVLEDDRWLNQLPKYIYDYLSKWHFNTENLPADQFINAAESKVYKPK